MVITCCLQVWSLSPYGRTKQPPQSTSLVKRLLVGVHLLGYALHDPSLLCNPLGPFSRISLEWAYSSICFIILYLLFL